MNLALLAAAWCLYQQYQQGKPKRRPKDEDRPAHYHRGAAGRTVMYCGEGGCSYVKVKRLG